MAWSTPVLHATGDVVPSADWNGLANDLTFLYGDAAWTSVPSFSNGWSAVGGEPPRYRKVGTLTVITGQMTGGTIDTTAFTLPAGYYSPTATAHITCVVNNVADSTGLLLVTTTGTVVPYAGPSSTTWSIDGVFSNV
jgi:hypothetical protein